VTGAKRDWGAVELMHSLERGEIDHLGLLVGAEEIEVRFFNSPPCKGFWFCVSVEEAWHATCEL
jgi:hypothetical protein